MVERRQDPATRGLRSGLFYYGWTIVLMAALAMTATLPGRTHGLGLITERLLADLQIERTVFAQINFWSCLLGAAFCVPIGWLIDRLGVRVMLAAVTVALGASVLVMTSISGPVSLFLTLVLVRGFGQSALSIVSMAMIGKWFRRRLGLAMGIFSVLLTFGFIGSILGMGEAIGSLGWRGAWAVLAYALLAFVPLGWLLVRSTPEACGIKGDEPQAAWPADDRQTFDDVPASASDFTLAQALRTPAFWVFVLGTSSFNLVWSSVMLFNESILVERGFDARTAVEIMAILTGVGLISNLVAGALASRERIGMILGTGLALLALALGVFPWITTVWQIRGYALAMGLTGGIIMVVFFAAWGHVFGRKHLGRIQGTAQLISVLASATGPVLMAECLARTGSYLPMFHVLAALVATLSLAAFLTRLPAPMKSIHRETAVSSAAIPVLQSVQE